ncbi:EfeM/EfeO family lipoprotein [Streptomyces sp. NPDC006552]|uniref:EfeM/EfeO family lipoprotein n=1 Tax=Streptomyces sp. NPDC006552 TaxID=3157179 RepID=UPI0033B3055E
MKDGAVYAEVEGLAPGTTRELQVQLGNGGYAFKCVPDDADAVVGPTVRIRGSRNVSGPAALPVTQHDLIPPTIAYQRWVTGQMDALVRCTSSLRQAVDAGELGKARSLWRASHQVYERMGAAYGTFGEADQAINGSDAGLPDGVHDDGFTGFHRLEQGLWHDDSVARLRPIAVRLLRDVRQLRKRWTHERMDPLDLGLRAHEVLENTLQTELTGRNDYGSGTGLATARANLEGTRAVLTRLRPVLAQRDFDLPYLERSLNRLERTLNVRRDNRWVPVAELDRSHREHINAAMGTAVEELAKVAALCDIRRNS